MYVCTVCMYVCAYQYEFAFRFLECMYIHVFILQCKHVPQVRIFYIDKIDEEYVYMYVCMYVCIYVC